MADPPPIDLRASAPFGRIGYRLGWRWAFWWTLPFPYHPYLFHAVAVGYVAWLFYLLAGPAPIRWASPLWAALILAIPLSAPFLQWFLLAFRLHLIQAAMMPAAMLLLGVAALSGQEPLGMTALPVLYFLCHGAAAVRSRTLLARIEDEIAAVERDRREVGGLPPLVLEGVLAHRADALMDGLGLPSLYSEQAGERRLHIRVDPTDAQLARRLATLSALPRPPVTLSGKHVAAFAAIRVADLPAAARLRPARWPGRSKRLVGRLTVIELIAPDGTVRRNYDGRAAPISWFPGFIFLFYLRLGAQAAYRLEGGVVRSKEHILGRLSGDGPPSVALVETLRDPALPTPAFAAPQLVAAALDEADEARVGADLGSLETLLSAPAAWLEDKLAALQVWPDRYADRADDLVDGLERAREAKRLMAGITLARLIARLPRGDFARIGARLLDLLGEPDFAEERKLPNAVRLKDLDKLPFRGFGLLTQVPDLYRRLGELDAPALPVIERLAERHGWWRSLSDAYRAITGRDPPNL